MSLSTISLLAASGLSLVGLIIHIRQGIPTIVQPLLEAELHPVPKHTLVFSWYWGAVTMMVLTFCFVAPLFSGLLWPLLALGSVYSYALGALSFWTMRSQKLTVRQMPQWILFWLATLFGFGSMWV